MEPLDYIINNDIIKSYNNNDTRYNDLTYRQGIILNSGCDILKNIISSSGAKTFILNNSLNNPIKIEIIKQNKMMQGTILTNYLGNVIIEDKVYNLSACRKISSLNHGGKDSQIEYYHGSNIESIPFNLFDIILDNDSTSPKLQNYDISRRTSHDKTLKQEKSHTINTSNPSNVEAIDSSSINYIPKNINSCESLKVGLYTLTDGFKLKILSSEHSRSDLHLFFVKGYLIKDGLYEIPILSCRNKGDFVLEFRVWRYFILDYALKRISSHPDLKPFRREFRSTDFIGYSREDNSYNHLTYSDNKIDNRGCSIINRLLIGSNPITFTLKKLINVHLFKTSLNKLEGTVTIDDKEYHFNHCNITKCSSVSDDSVIYYQDSSETKQVSFNLFDIEVNH